jgi:hypothetical protein
MTILGWRLSMVFGFSRGIPLFQPRYFSSFRKNTVNLQTKGGNFQERVQHIPAGDSLRWLCDPEVRIVPSGQDLPPLPTATRVFDPLGPKPYELVLKRIKADNKPIPVKLHYEVNIPISYLFLYILINFINEIYVRLKPKVLMNTKAQKS